MKILFVCTGNTCRSPMAQALAADIDGKNKFFSAGISVNEDSISENAVRVCEEIGIDISGYVPKQLTRTLIDDADIIVPITKRHGAVLEQLGAKEKIKYFQHDVPDPYGQDISVYRECRDALSDMITRLLGEWE